MLKIRKEAKIGLLVFIVIAILIWGMNYLKGINILSSKDKYYVIYDRIEGLQKTSPILLRGYKIGFVGDIYFDETNKNNIIVELMIDNNFKLPKNTIASIFSSDLMG
ncbi:MAG: MCE family protein, partial [Bacteroidales bacterium]|nr:MCE family protein [Bacteroidales bacterium]